jgi:hypothetical protein
MLSDALWIRQNKLLLEIFGRDLVQRAGSDLRRNAQFFRLGQNFLVLQAELF